MIDQVAEDRKRLFGIWKTMIGRCTKPSWKMYRRYGGRGISVCEEWMNSFDAFYEWATSHGHDRSLSIDRINNGGNYHPGNCRWATSKEQANNWDRSSVIRKPREKRLSDIVSDTMTITAAAKRIGCTRNTIYRMIRERRLQTVNLTPDTRRVLTASVNDLLQGNSPSDDPKARHAN